MIRKDRPPLRPPQNLYVTVDNVRKENRMGNGKDRITYVYCDICINDKLIVNNVAFTTDQKISFQTNMTDGRIAVDVVDDSLLYQIKYALYEATKEVWE